MAWGVDDLSVPERVGKAVMAGTDIIADTNDVGSIREAYLRGLFSPERLDEAARRLTEEMFALGLFDNPYVDPERADAVVANDRFAEAASEAHLEVGGSDEEPRRHAAPWARPVGREARSMSSCSSPTCGSPSSMGCAPTSPQRTQTSPFTTDYADADVAVLFLNPFTGTTSGPRGCWTWRSMRPPTSTSPRSPRSAPPLPQLVIGLDVMLPWLLGNVEPLADALLAGFDTRTEALFEVIVGKVAPSGRLPLTFPCDPDAVAVDENGICASPNDVPGYDKEAYMDGRPYVYVDTDGNKLPTRARPVLRLSETPPRARRLAWAGNTNQLRAHRGRCRRRSWPRGLAAASCNRAGRAAWRSRSRR